MYSDFVGSLGDPTIISNFCKYSRKYQPLFLSHILYETTGFGCINIDNKVMYHLYMHMLNGRWYIIGAFGLKPSCHTMALQFICILFPEY